MRTHLVESTRVNPSAHRVVADTEQGGSFGHPVNGHKAEHSRRCGSIYGYGLRICGISRCRSAVASIRRPAAGHNGGVSDRPTETSTPQPSTPVLEPGVQPSRRPTRTAMDMVRSM